MENDEKSILEKIKSIELNKLFVKGTYVDIYINKCWCEGIIKEINENKYDIIYLFKDRQLKRKQDIKLSSLSIIGENTNSVENLIRAKCLNNDIFQMEKKELIEFFMQKIQELNINLDTYEIVDKENENNKEKEDNNYKGFNLHQFLSGTFIDILIFIRMEVEENKIIKKNLGKLILLSLDIFILILKQIKSKLSKIKFFINNKRSLLFDNIYSIFASFQTILSNIKFIFNEDFNSTEAITEKKNIIINECYQLILNNTDNNYYIPIQILVILISFITMNNSTKKSIIKFQQPKIYQTYLKTIENFSETDIKNIKKLSKIKEYSSIIVKGLFSENKENNTRLINECYFNLILICLKCNILEKKISAMNSINDILLEDDNNEYFYQFFIIKNKILDIFFEESIHDEVIKRSNNLFEYLAKHDKLEENIINRLIDYQNKKEFYKNILIDVIAKLPSIQKEKAFKNIIQKFDFNENSSEIEYLLKLIEACLIPNKNTNETEKEKENEENDKNYKIGLYGVDLLFKYIIKDFDIKKSLEINNIDKAIDVFNRIKYLRFEDKYKYIEKLFDNIKLDNEHKSVIQSIILIQKLLSNINNYKEASDKNLFEELDNKYQIFNLIINDLIRYTNIIKDKKIIPEPNDIYEGIYTFNINIEERLKMIFFFAKGNKLKKGLKLDSKEHLEKIYSIFNNELFHNELIKFFSIFSSNINSTPNSALEEFLFNVIQNEKKFDLSSFSEFSIYFFIIKVFLRLNTSEDIIIFDKKSTHVKKDNVKNLDLLFDILVKNKNIDIQNKLSDFLQKLCLNLYDYNTSFCQNYWKNYINKIVNLFENAQKEKNILGLSTIIKLIDLIYSSCINFGGNIPKKNQTHTAAAPNELYQFSCPDKKKKQYKILVGEKDSIMLMRWKLGYYYDIQINNVVFEDKDGKRYSFMDEQLIFQEIFPPKIYCPNKNNLIAVKVCEEKDLLLKIKGNPKELIENNEIIFNILIQNLSSESLIDNKTKQQIWNIISKFKKELYFTEIKKFGEKEILSKEIITKMFNINELYIFIYALQCIEEYIKKDNEIKQEFLNNFINIHNIDKILYNTFMNFDTTPNKCQLIHYECLIVLVDIIKIIESYKEKDDNKKLIKIIDTKDIFKKFSNIILDLIQINYDDLYKKAHFNDYDIVDEEDNDNKLDYITKKMDKMISDLLKNIINLTEQISSENENIFMEYLFNDIDLFKNIFIYNYIKCEKKDIHIILNEYLSKHLFNINDDKFIQKYFDIVLSVKIFNEIVQNDIYGSFFKELCNLMKKYEIIYKEKKDIAENNLEQFIKIIDLIIDYIETECKNAGYIQIFGTCEKLFKTEKTSNSSKTEGILKFLKCILNLSPKKLVNHLVNKIDIVDLFLIKCILRKSNNTPLDTQKMLCDTEKSKEVMFDLILFIIKNLRDDKKNLEEKIWDILDSKNKLGFWKTNKTSNWKLEPEGISNYKYVGLKNMSSTCYMNSIIQQFFMIPMFRETILSISNVKNDTVLYQLQLLFSALKTYECDYYNPRPFVVKSELDFYEQMDADEYFGQFIDRIENDIKDIYSEKNEENPYKNLFKFFFGIKVIDELKFVDCGHKRFNEFYNNNIQLEIKGFNNIEDSLKNYCKTEIMDGDNKINCEICNIKRTCHKRQILKSLPNILFIALKRFEFDYDSMIRIKLNNYFQFPFELNMKNYLIEENNEINTEYELTGITIHDGTADFGHYYDLIKAPDENWYKFNDTRVKIFDKEDIPKEAFGEQNIEDKIEEEDEEKENNAYILIYTKKNFNKEELKNLEINFKTTLAKKPYDKMSYINKENKSIINLDMYKFWILENITDNSYQEFILNLLKISIVRNLNFDLTNIEKDHTKLFKDLKEEGYLNTKDNNDEIKSENDFKIFEYGIRYYFNVLLRITKNERECINDYDEIIKIYLETDIEKCKYILEELSDNDSINEYLVFCPIEENVKYVSDIINTAFKIYYTKIEDKSFLFNYINSLWVFIYYNIDNICLEYVIKLLNQLIKIGEDKKIINYLKEKNIKLWLNFIEKDEEEITEEDEANNDIIMSSDNLPIIKSKHFILTEKENLEINNKDNNENKKYGDVGKANEKRLKNTDINFDLLKKIGKELNE